MSQVTPEELDPDEDAADWHRRVVGRSLKTATQRSIDRGASLIRAAATLLERSNGDDFTVQDVADEAGQSLRTLYQYFESKDDLLLAVFEEAMRTYARMVRDAIVDLEDPLERLCGGMLAAARMREFGGRGVDRGLTRLRLRLGELHPELVARSQEPLTGLVRELVTAAAEAGRIRSTEPEESTYLVVALETAYITSLTLGNDVGVPLPSAYTVTSFCLGGLGASVDEHLLEAIEAKLRMPARRVTADRPGSKRASKGGQRKDRRTQEQP